MMNGFEIVFSHSRNAFDLEFDDLELESIETLSNELDRYCARIKTDWKNLSDGFPDIGTNTSSLTEHLGRFEERFRNSRGDSQVKSFSTETSTTTQITH